MRSLLFLLIALAMPAAFAETYVCETGPEAKPSDVYIINFQGNENTVIQYQRFPFYGAEVISPTLDVPGCAPAQVAYKSSSKLYVECDGDGDAGYLSIKLDGDKIQGTVDFPEGNIGYPDNTILTVSCRKN